MSKWNYTIRNGKSLRTAIREEDYNRVLLEISTAYHDIALNYPGIDVDTTEECEMYSMEVEELIDTDEPTDEDEVNYHLNEFYDFCDYMRIWIGI